MRKLLLTLSVVFWASALCGQDATVKHRALNLTIKNYGVSFGNSKKVNGLRFNIQDKGLEKVNGINFTFWLPDKDQKPNSVINGVAAGIISPYASVVNGMSVGLGFGGEYLNGVHLGVLGGGSENRINGFAFGGLGLGAGNDVNGVMIGGLGAGCGDNMTGLIIGGLGNGCGENLKGISIGGLGCGCGEDATGVLIGGLGAGCGNDLTGIGIGGFGVGAGNSIKGLAISLGMIKTLLFKGVAIASYLNVDSYRGVSFAIFNRVKNLKGVEFGLINYVGNNPKLFRVMPLINFHFKND